MGKWTHEFHSQHNTQGMSSHQLSPDPEQSATPSFIRRNPDYKCCRILEDDWDSFSMPWCQACACGTIISHCFYPVAKIFFLKVQSSCLVWQLRVGVKRFDLEECHSPHSGYFCCVHKFPNNITIGGLPLWIELYPLSGLSITAELACNLQNVQVVTHLALNSNNQYIRNGNLTWQNCSLSRSISQPQIKPVSVLSTNSGPIPKSDSNWMPDWCMHTLPD